MAPLDIETVAIIVERDAGSRIAELAGHVYVWAIDTEENRRAADRVWSQAPGEAYELGVTVFSSGDLPPDDVVARELATIDRHHGEGSQSPRWSRALVYGAALSPLAREAFRRIGFDQFEETDDGFVAKRHFPD